MQNVKAGFLIFFIYIPLSYTYMVPEINVELLEDAFRISLPDEVGIKNVAFNINRNRNFTTFLEGEFSAQVNSPDAGRWTHDFPVVLNARDTIYMWTNVQHGHVIYRHISSPKPVCELSGIRPTECPSKALATTTRPSFISLNATLTPTNPKSCEQSITEVVPPQGNPICKGQLIFEENFEQSIQSRWLHEMRAPLDSMDAEFSLYAGMAQVEDGNLVIKPKLWSEYRPDMDLMRAHLDFAENCTGTHNKQTECVVSTRGPFIIPPVVVPRVSTRESFAFKYGRIQIRAKVPKGDWIIPLLLLEPLTESYGQTGYESGQLRVAMVRGNTNLLKKNYKSINGNILYGGAVLSTDAYAREDYMVNVEYEEHFGNKFHVYELQWNSDNLQFLVDGQPYGEILNTFSESNLNPSWRKGGRMAPFDKPFFITLGISVGGFGDFIDDVVSNGHDKPWLNKEPRARLHFWRSRDTWHRTWQQHTKLLVDYVRVYAN